MIQILPQIICNIKFLQYVFGNSKNFTIFNVIIKGDFYIA